jgi:hypothetical protein
MNPTGVFRLSNLVVFMLSKLVALLVHSANFGSHGTFPALYTLSEDYTLVLPQKCKLTKITEKIS